MAKTIVISGADYAANALDQISFGGEIPCTGFYIDESTASLPDIGSTQTLTVVKTPQNTTDEVVWTTSDADVAVVSNGVITAIGMGTCTITGTCGEYSDTVTVTVNAIFDASWELGNHAISTTTQSKRIISGLELSTAMFANVKTGTYPVSNFPNDYPIMIPKGCTKIHVEADGYWIGIAWSDSTQTEYKKDGVDYCVGVGGNAASSSTGIGNDYTYDVPNDADSYVLVIRKKQNTAITEADIANVTVTYLAS